jgi:hypothetical protein
LLLEVRLSALGLLARVVFGIISLALALLAAGLIVFAGIQLVAVFSTPEPSIGRTLLDAVGYTIIAIAVFEVAKYIFEEEVLDPTELRHAGEARRSLTKFISTIAIVVFLETIVAIFQTSRSETISDMLYPTLLLFGGVALVVGLGAFQRLSTSAERDSQDPDDEQRGSSLPKRARALRNPPRRRGEE